MNNTGKIELVDLGPAQFTLDLLTLDSAIQLYKREGTIAGQDNLRATIIAMCHRIASRWSTAAESVTP